MRGRTRKRPSEQPRSVLQRRHSNEWLPLIRRRDVSRKGNSLGTLAFRATLPPRGKAWIERYGCGRPMVAPTGMQRFFTRCGPPRASLPSPALFIFSHCVYLIAKKPQMQELSRGFNSFSYFPVFPLLFYHILTASARKISKRKSFSACRNIPATHLRRGVDFCR